MNASAGWSTPILTIEVCQEQDVVLARQRARQVATLLGFDPMEQTRIATAASEVAREVAPHSGGGAVDFLIEGGTSPSLAIRIRARGLKADDLLAVLDGRREPSAGLGPGLLGARRLMDRCTVAPAPGGGAAILLEKGLPRRAPAPDPARISSELARHSPRDAVTEMQQQNRELLRALEELRDRQEETAQLNRELEETNRGVVALYAELDEKANSLRRASELKSRFLSNMSHEFRSPLNSILSLCRFLLGRTDGDLTVEQEKQVAFIRKAAEGLSELVNDLLDLAKVEAGKLVVRPAAFETADLFSTLRGMIRPLLAGDAVALVFEPPAGIPPLLTDEGKVAQVLRNFLANALKFTERGEIRVAAVLGRDDAVTFTVADTGIGIAPEDLDLIFEEFGQVGGAIQDRVQGTGLGLPLSRRLAELLGGSVSVRSAPGVGSTFSAVIPRIYREAGEAPPPQVDRQPDPARVPVLVVEDDLATLYLYERYLEGSGYQVLPARTIDDARRVLAEVRPAAVVLDIMLEEGTGWPLLTELKRREETRSIPVLVLTMVDGQEKAMALGADEFGPKPAERVWLREKLAELVRRGRLGTLLIVDDDEVARYVLRGLLADLPCTVIEAANGREGLRRAWEDRPQAILLDLVMPDMTGFQVLDRLKSDPATAGVPVIIHSSKVLDDEERGRLAATVAILSKDETSRESALARLRKALAHAGLGPAQSKEGTRG